MRPLYAPEHILKGNTLKKLILHDFMLLSFDDMFS